LPETVQVAYIMAPDDAALEKALVDAVNHMLATGDDSGVTVNSVRKHVEEELGLEEGFFRSDEWKTRSKELIRAANVSLVASPILEATSNH
jgi:hypothetical protein